MFFLINLLIKLDFVTSVGDLRVYRFNDETFIVFYYFKRIYIYQFLHFYK